MNNSYLNNIDNFRILLSPNLELALQTMSNEDVVATVEAEYGDYCVEGKLITLAHHGSRSANPAPCNTPNIPVLNGGTILVSHLDLDAIGGIAKLMGYPFHSPEFWQGAELIDVNGMHHIHELSSAVQTQLNSFYAWYNTQPRTFYKATTDVTDIVKTACQHLEIILTPSHPRHNEFIESGIKWKEASTDAIEKRLVYEDTYVRAFKTDAIFCGASYYSPKQGKIIPSTVSLNTSSHAITVAFEDGGIKHNASSIVTELWGEKAGGRRGIAGSPRNWDITEACAEKEFQKCIARVRAELQ